MSPTKTPNETESILDDIIESSNPGYVSGAQYATSPSLLARYVNALRERSPIAIVATIAFVALIVLLIAVGVASRGSHTSLDGDQGADHLPAAGSTDSAEIVDTSTGNVSQVIPESASAGNSSSSSSNDENSNDEDSTSEGVSQLPIEPNRDPDLDVCPNLFDIQTAVPPNLILDSNNNCVTPPNKDVCPNIDDVQTAIPSGLAKDAAGNCVAPAQDLCKNINDVQTVLPPNYFRDSSGNCTLDMCLNIPQLQATVPSGHTRDSKGNCIATPAPVVRANILNLKPWKLTLPINSSGGLGGSAIEIVGKDLTRYTKSPWYIPVRDPKTAKVTHVKFYVTDRGATTGSSSNPRSELREMTSTGGSIYNWNPYRGSHRMLIRQKVTILTGRKHVVIGQIHDVDKTIDDYAVFRLQNTTLYAYINGKESSSVILDRNVRLGQMITVGFSVDNGIIKFYYTPTGSVSKLQLKKSVRYPSGSKKAYFKAGDYCQCGIAKGYNGSSGVEIHGLGITHTGRWPDIGGN